MNEKSWALTGKIMAVVLTFIGIVTGIYQIKDRLQSASVYCIVNNFDKYINPQIRTKYNDRIEYKSILTIINARKKKGDSPKEILDYMISMSSDEKNRPEIIPPFDLEFGVLNQNIIVFQIINDGSSIARDVKIVLPGEGQAEIEESGIAMSQEPKSLAWSAQIPVGDIRPNGRVGVRVWPKSMLLSNVESLNPAVIFAGGTGRVMFSRSFYGWDADLVSWFVNSSMFIRYTLVILLVCVVVSLFKVAYERGYVVLRPKKE